MYKGVWVRERLVDGVYMDDYVDECGLYGEVDVRDYDDNGDYQEALCGWVANQFRDID